MVLIVGQNILFMNFIIITEIITAGVRWLIIHKSCSIYDLSLEYIFAFYKLKLLFLTFTQTLHRNIDKKIYEMIGIILETHKKMKILIDLPQ